MKYENLELFGKSNIYHLGILITYICNGRCPNCITLCGPDQAPSNENMPIEKIEKLINDSIELKYPWKIWIVSGGEPTFHPQFKEIILLMEEYKKNYNSVIELVVGTNGYSQHTKNMNAFAVEHGFGISDSGKSEAWINGKTIFPYVAVNYAPIDLGIDHGVIGCNISRDCGINYTNEGFWECQLAASAVRVFEPWEPATLELKDVSEDKIYASMVKHCKYCGYGVKMDRVKYQLSSKTWKKAFEKYRNNEGPLHL